MSAYLSSDALTLAVGVVQGLLLARILGASSYGALGVLLSSAALVFAVLDPRAGEVMSRYLGHAYERREGQRGLALVWFAHVLDAALLAAALALFVSLSYPVMNLIDRTAPSAVDLLLAGVAVGVGSPATTARAALLAVGAVEALARAQAVLAAIRLVAVILVVLAVDSVRSALVLTATLAALDAAALTGLLWLECGQRFGAGPWSARRAPLSDRREVVRFLVAADLSSLVSAAVKQADLLVVAMFAGSVEAGYYRLGRQLSNAVSIPAASLQVLFFPRFASAFASADLPRLLRLRRTAFKLGGGLAVVTLLALPLVELLIDRLVGPSFSGAVAVTQLLVGGAVLSSGFFAFRPLFLSSGLQRSFLTIVTLCSSLAVVSFLALAPAFGASGVALARLVLVSALPGVLGLVVFRRRLRRWGTTGLPTAAFDRKL